METKKKPLKKVDDESAQKREIVEAYVLIVRQEHMFPTRGDLAAMGVSRDKIRHHFVNLSGLRKAAKAMFPESFQGIIQEDDFIAPKARAKLAKEIKKTKTFIVTTAVNGQWAHSKFIEGLDALAKRYDARLLMLPCHDPAHNLDNEIEWHFDDKLQNHTFVFDELRLNSNLYIGQMGVNAKQINPTTGLSRICQGKGSFIFASPKQSLEYDPVSNVKFPHARMTTGTCTVGNYNTTRGNSIRSAKIAAHDHVIGALIIEVEDDSIYHFRQIQADDKGGFCDLGQYYLGHNVPKKVIPKLVMGDYHAGEHDDTAVSAWEEIIDVLGVDEVFFHDLFNGKSINHHEEHNIVLRARHAKVGLLSLKSELLVTGQQVDRILNHKSIKKGIVVKSNHDDFLQRWLNEGKFKHDPINFSIGCALAADAVETNIDTLKNAIDKYGNVKNWKKLIFLKRNEDYKIAGIELGAHGDKGPSGSRGSKANLENAYGKAVIAHSHTPGILRGVFQVGTTSLFDLGYNQTASSWMHCSCLVYENGSRQLINSIGGKWRLNRK